MNKILITGGAGFVGYHTAKTLSKDSNNKITIVDNLIRGQMDLELKKLLDKENVKFINGDITNPQFFYNVGYDFKYIYHFAAIIGVKNVFKKPEKVLAVNAIATLNLFEYAKKLPYLEKILFSSTSEIYAGTLKHYGIKIPTDENVNLTVDNIKSPRTTYALSKMFGESVCFNFDKRFNIPFTIVRYHNVYGPRMGFAHVIPELFVKIDKNDEIDLPSPKHTRAFCYIDDAVKMTIKLCTSKKAGNEIFHIGNSNEEIKIVDLAKTIALVMGKDIRINELDNTPGSTKRRCPSIKKMQKFIKFNPQISLKEGIIKTFKWYSDKLNNVYE